MSETVVGHSVNGSRSLGKRSSVTREIDPSVCIPVTYYILNLEFDQTRFLTKVNYTLQTKAIEENILPRLNRSDKPFVFANEADLLNQVVFGLTAQQWRESNPDLKGNIRDNASLLELNILNNLQSRNAELIKDGVEAELRFRVLLKVAQNQFKVLAEDERLTPPDEQNLIG